MKLSVVLPTYNRIDMLLHSLRAVCGVAHRPLEVIVVDDGSEDGTAERCAEMEEICESAGAEFKFIRQSNSGAATARNTGCDHATGELIQWVDSDDTVRPEGVDTLVAALKDDHQLEVAYGLVLVVDADGKGTQTMGKAPEGWETDYFDYLWHTMAAVYRRPALAKVGRWNPRLTMPDDWEFSSRVRIAGCRYRFFDVVVGNYVQHGINTLTTTNFDAAKCYNAVEATLSLREAFIKAGKYTRFIQQRCFNRVFVHALELASKNSDLASDALANCRAIGSPNLCLKSLCALVTLLPSSFVHRELFLLLRRDTDGKLRSMLQSSSGQTSSHFPQEAEPTDDLEHALPATVRTVCLTAVCPTYDRSKLVVEAITSFLAHSPADWEMIVVDDGSTDDTSEKVEALQKSAFPHTLRLIKQAANAGAPKARNVGLAAAQGRYVMFVDSDDTVNPEGVRRLVGALDHGTADFAYGVVHATTGAGGDKQILSTIGKRWPRDSRSIVDLSWHTMGAVYRKEFLREQVGGWNEELSGSQDWEYQARVKMSRGNAEFVDALVGDWRQDAGNRIGQTGYSRNYIENVLKATLAIERAAATNQLLDSNVRRRLSMRLLNHAIEAAAHGETELAARLTSHCKRLGPGIGGRAVLLLLRACRAQGCARALLRAIRRAQGIPTAR